MDHDFGILFIDNRYRAIGVLGPEQTGLNNVGSTT